MNAKFFLTFSKESKKDIKKLEKQIANRILDKLEYFINSGNPLIYSKRLKDKAIADYRFRIGNYRIFFDKNIEGEIIILFIIAIKHRKEAY